MPVARLRHVAGIFVGAALLVFVLEPLVLSGPTPLVSRVDADDRVELYKQVATVTASLAGFLITAIAILVSLDLRRQIVEELHRGEAFSLLVVNLLAAVVFLVLTTGIGIAGAIFDDGRNGADVLESIWEVLVLASIVEFGLGLFLFAIVTYKVASQE